MCMIELGELERQWKEFDQRKVEVVVISIEDRDKAKATQADFPHLRVVSDAQRSLIDAAGVIHPRAAPDGSDAAAPTTILVDGQGIVRWTFRPSRVPTRLSPADVLAAIDREMPPG